MATVEKLGTRDERLPKAAMGVLSLLMLISFLTRAVLLGMAGHGNVPFSAWPRVFLLGAWFDLLVAMATVSPLLLLAALALDWWRLSRFYAVMRFLTLWGICLGVLFAAVAEVTFW